MRVSDIGAALRAVFQPVPGDLIPPRKSRNINEAIARLTCEAGKLTTEATPINSLGDALDDIARRR